MLTPQDILGPDGLIASRLKHYEHRSQQQEMADAVNAAISNGHHLIVEAGTGVGKSFGYLVPAILRVTRDDTSRSRPEKRNQSKPRIIVSTHTISLQEQLMSKDLPFLKSVIPRDYNSVLVKGRGNYLSLRRLDLALGRARNLFGSSDERQLEFIRDWSKETLDGSLSSMAVRPSPAVWDEVVSDSDNCLGKKCEMYSKCFYYAARRRVHEANILVVNHSLFFSDLALRRDGASILPEYEAVIFDEAHTLESVASQHMGIDVSSSQVEYTLNKLYNDSSNRGLFTTAKLADAQKLTMECRDRSHDFFSDVFLWLQKSNERTARARAPEIVPNRLSDPMLKLSEMVSEYGKRVDDESLQQDFVSASNKLMSMALSLESWRTQNIQDAVYWVESNETRRGTVRLTLSAAPIDVAGTLRRELFEKVRSVVLTSATLASGPAASFDFVRSRIGMLEGRSLQVGSPFNYTKQARIILVPDMPDPTTDRDDFERLLAAMLQRYVKRTDGRAFALFTSYDLIRRMVDRLGPWLSQNGYALYSQADGTPRNQLLDKFKANPRGVLMGTDSFWQGVDVPGDALQNVIITKLPFSVPDHPLLEARLDAIRNAGGNPFYGYQLPEAVIKLRQGFGRLIRTQRDHGIVVILDPRVRTKKYGQVFLDSLPNCPVIEESITSTDDEAD